LRDSRANASNGVVKTNSLTRSAEHVDVGKDAQARHVVPSRWIFSLATAGPRYLFVWSISGRGIRNDKPATDLFRSLNRTSLFDLVDLVGYGLLFNSYTIACLGWIVLGIVLGNVVQRLK
jgi:hypothetical protein